VNASISDDLTIRYVDDLETLRHIFRTWRSEFGDREIDVLDLKPATTTGRLLLGDKPWSAIRLNWRLHWLRDLVAADLRLVRIGTSRWKVVPVTRAS
jgi:hypothetical protein